MFIKYIDFLSPRVTFYHKGLLSHSSIFSGILSIITIIAIILFSVYYSLELFERKDPKAFYFHNFLKDAGEYEFNTTSLFHFLSIIRNHRDGSNNEPFDFTIYRIVGAQLYVTNYLNTAKFGGIQAFDHWLYGYCNKEKNTKNLDHLITNDFFKQSACIKSYYNHTERQYYDIGHPKFRWPSIAHGTFSDSNQLYGIFLQKCNNITLKKILGEGYQCKNDQEVANYLGIQGSRVFHFYLLNNYVNILNYKSPYINYFHRIETPFSNIQHTRHDIYISPANVTTHDGLAADHAEINISYIFDKDDAYIENKGEFDIYTSFIFFLKNMVDYNERNYKKIQDVISEVGGIYQAVIVIAICINNLYNNYVILSDTEQLLQSTIFNEKENNRKKSIEYNHTKHKSKIKSIDTNFQNIKDKKKYSERGNLKTGSTIEKIIDKGKINNMSIGFEDSAFQNKNKNISNTDVSNQIQSNANTTVKIENTLLRTLSIRSQNIKAKSFFSYLYFRMTCRNKNNYYLVYEDFRIKIISEEHIIRNHLNIYSLLKITERKRHKRRNSYQLKDVIKMI